MGKLRKELGIELNPIRVVESALGKVGNIFEGAVGIITSGIKSIGTTVENILKDPLPAIIQVVGAMNGIPPYVTSAAITAAKGGNLEDIAKSAAISYATSTFMQNTNIGQAIGQASKDIGSDFTVGLIEKYDLPMDTAVMVSRAATASLNSAFIGGVSAAISGQSISKGLTSGFTSGLLYSTTDSFFDALNKDPNWGFSPTALNLIKGAANTALSTIVSGKGDPAAAVGNYVAYATLKMGTSSLYDSVVKAYEDFTGKTAAAEAAQDSYTTLKAQYDAEVARYNKTIADLKVNEETYKNVYNQQYLPIKNQLESYEATAKSYQYHFDIRKKEFEQSKAVYENFDEWAQNNQPFVDAGLNQTYWYNDANWKAAEANRLAAEANKFATQYSDLANSASTQAVIGSLRTAEANMNANVATLTSIQSNIETPANGNLAEQLKNAAEKYQKEYSNYASSKDAAERAAQNYNKIIAEVAARDATIDAVNSGAIDVVKDFGNGSYQLSNGLVMQDGKFFQDGLPAFTNAAGISQNSLEFADPKGNVVKYGVDTGRQLSSTDVKNIFARDYGITINDTDAKTFVGASYTNYDANKFKTFAFTKPLQEAAKEEGVTLTPAEIEAFVKNSTDITSAVQKVKEYADPRYMTVSEAQQALMDAGFSTEDAKVLAGQAAGSGVGNVEQVVTSNRPKLEEKAKQDLIKAGFSEETAELLAPKAAGPAANMAEVLNNREQLVPMVATPAEDVDGTKVGTLSAEGKEYADRLYDELKQMWPEAQDQQIKSVAEVVSSDMENWIGSMGRPVDVENPTQFGRGMAMGNGMLGISTNMAALQISAVAIAQANKNLSRYDQIDQGQQGEVLQQPGISNYTRFKLNQYITGDEETRRRLRNEEVGAIEQENKEVRSNMLRVFETYKELAKYRPGSEAEELNPYVPPSSVENFTDIETARQFGSWLAYNMGSGLVQFAPILAAGLTAGGAGVLALGATFGLQEAIGQRIQQLTKDTPNWSTLSEDAQADLIIKKMQESAGTNVLVGMGVGVLDTVLGPAAGAVKNSLFRAAAKDIVASGAVTALKGMPKEAAEEFVAGNLQQLAQIVGSRHLGEQTGDLFSVENLKAMFNAGMAETAGSIAGGGANVFVSGGLQQFGQASLDVAARKIDEQVKTQDLPQTELIRTPIVQVDTTGTRYIDTSNGLVLVENPQGEVSLLDANTGKPVNLSNDDKLALINRYAEPASTVTPVAVNQPKEEILGRLDNQSVDEAEVRQALKDVGYDNPTVEDIAPYLGQKNQAQTLQNAASVFDAKVIDADEAAAALRDRGYKPLPEEIAQFTGVKPESGLSAAIDEYINPREVTRDEARKVFTDLGYTPSEEEISAYVRTPQSDVSQSAVEKQIAEYTDPRVIDAKEAEAALKEAGYKSPTAAEISKFTGVKPESGLKSDVQSYVDPRQVTEAEVRKIFSDYGYTPTNEEVAKYVRDANANVSQSDIEKQISTFADPLAVDKEEAKAALRDLGLEDVTDADVTRLIGMYPESDLSSKTKDLYDTIQIDRLAGEVAKIQSKIGAPSTLPTVEDALYAQRIAVGMVPGVGRNSTLPGFDKNYDINNDGRVSAADSLLLLKMAKGVDIGPIPAGLKWQEPTGLYKRMLDVERAVNNIQFPDTLSEEDVRNIVNGAFEKNPGLTESDVTRVVTDALGKLPSAPTKQDVTDAVNAGIGSRSVVDDPNTPQNEAKDATGIYKEIERIEQAIAGIDIPESLSEQQVKDIVAGVFEDNPGLSTTDVKDIVNDALNKLPVAPTLEEISREVNSIVGAPSVKDNPSTPENEARAATGVYRSIEATAAGLETRLGAAIDAAKKAGAEGNAALDLAIKDVARQIGVSETALLNKIGKTAEDLSKDFAAQLQKIGEQLTTVENAIGKPESVDENGNKIAATGLYADIAKNEAAGMSREAATQKAVAELSAKLGESETAIRDALTASETALGERITTVEQAIGAPESVDAQGNKIAATGLFAEIAKNEAAGMTREAATQKAIADLSKQLGASEAAIKNALAATESTLGGRITTVEQAIGAPASVDANGNPIAATGIFAEIAKNEAAGMSRDAATQKAIADLSRQLGTSEAAIKTALAATESTLGGRITTVEQAVGAPESVDANGNKVAATGLFAEIAKNEAAGMSRDAATQKAIADLSADLGVAQNTILGEMSKAEARFGTALTGVQTALTNQITASQNQIMERMAVYEQAGIDRDTALNLAIQDVSAKLGGQMSNLQQLVGKPATVATQTDIDAINQMIAGTKPVNLSYDVTGDKLVDVRDLDALRDWMSGTTPITPIAGSPWAPTGLYEELAKAAADRERIATEQSRQAQETQRRGNVMQMLNMIGQDPTAGGQQVTVKAADPAKIGYIYDWSSIFANPQQQQMFASPFAEGGEVADTDELIAILRGSHG